MTRMWCVDPELLCRQHLLGEHKELHQLVGHVRAGNTNAIHGHAERGQIDTSRVSARHRTLVAEMERRGYNHNSPLEYDDSLNVGNVDESANLVELRERCVDCQDRIDSANH
ncbi:pyrimidine dimer DNA glycosylase/endonuclease V [Halomicroarcula sp. F27]|uniref:Pyrimidine dimer DNA glycosylase/endonuclease V n=1 Tax=Haloarcula nitratireducens TaxID=2487749 RepID=A0AAW4PJJ5_9EURY|nr:pyrimidine dimer DNA glycosylase/endonuclease V [Halomicroarcula nitratireducens]